MTTKHTEMDEIAELRAKLAAKEKELEDLKTKKASAPRVARKLTPEEQKAKDEKAAGRVSFETIEYAKSGSNLRKLQDMGRATHVYAFYKVIKHLSYDRLAKLLDGLITEVATSTGKTHAAVMEQVTSRTPKAPKAEAPPAAEPPQE